MTIEFKYLRWGRTIKKLIRTCKYDQKFDKIEGGRI